MPFCIIEALDLKQVLKTLKVIMSFMECDASHTNFCFTDLCQ